MRIKKNSYYILSSHPGISGFKDYSTTIQCVVTGHKAMNARSYVVAEFLANGIRNFRLDNGHLPEFQPIVKEVDALRFLDSNPFSTITEV